MPSEQSAALRDMYKAMVSRLAANPPIDSVRDMLEGISRLAAEPTHVTTKRSPWLVSRRFGQIR
jgi:hypothetical protein